MKIETLYLDRQELLIDLDIYGKIISTPQQSFDDMRQSMFEEFKTIKPVPTLEMDRYKLSQQVDANYKIQYEQELLLHENESIIDLDAAEKRVNFYEFSDLASLTREEKEQYANKFSISMILRKRK